jgi:hypothetical protein
VFASEIAVTKSPGRFVPSLIMLAVVPVGSLWNIVPADDPNPAKVAGVQENPNWLTRYSSYRKASDVH